MEVWLRLVRWENQRSQGKSTKPGQTLQVASVLTLSLMPCQSQILMALGEVLDMKISWEFKRHLLLDDVRCVNVYKQLATEVPLIVFQSPTTSYLEEWPATEYPVGGFNPSEKYEGQLGLLFPKYDTLW